MINLSFVDTNSFYVFFLLYLISVFWGYHKQGSCQAGLSAAITKVNITDSLPPPFFTLLKVVCIEVVNVLNYGIKVRMLYAPTYLCSEEKLFE